MAVDPPVAAVPLSAANTSAPPRVATEQSARDFQKLFTQDYTQLRAMAQKQITGERDPHTMHATELVHEAFLRLKDDSELDLQNRGYFFHAAAEAMRRILIEHARHRSRLKRGGDRQRVTLSLEDRALPENSRELLALDEALQRLQENDPRTAEVVQLRYFAGLTIEQTAAAMDLSARTVKREWEFARAWLQKELQ